MVESKIVERMLCLLSVCCVLEESKEGGLKADRQQVEQRKETEGIDEADIRTLN